MRQEMFLGSIGKSSQLEQSVRKAAEARTHHRVRKVIERAVEGGVASTVHVKPGEVLYRQGDRSRSFYLVEKVLIPPHTLSLTRGSYG